MNIPIQRYLIKVSSLVQISKQHGSIEHHLPYVNLLLYRYIANIDPAWTKKKGTKKKATKKKATKKKRRIPTKPENNIPFGQPRKSSFPIFPTLRSPPKEPYTGPFGKPTVETSGSPPKEPYKSPWKPIETLESPPKEPCKSPWKPVETLRSPPKEPYTGLFGEPTKTLEPLSKGPYKSPFGSS